MMMMVTIQIVIMVFCVALTSYTTKYESNAHNVEAIYVHTPYLYMQSRYS